MITYTQVISRSIMKKLFILSTALLILNHIHAQCPINKGQAQINTGLGFSSRGLPIYLGVDVGIHKDVTLGGEFSFRSYSDTWANEKYRHSAIGVLTNGNYHFNHLLEIPLEWDVYAGANIGFYFWNSPDDYPGSSFSGLGLGIQIGGRYYFNEKVALNLEITGGNTLSGGKIGVSFKL